MKLKPLDWDHNNVLVRCIGPPYVANTASVYLGNTRYESSSLSREILHHDGGEKCFLISRLHQNTPKCLNNKQIWCLYSDDQLHFHIHQTTLSPGLLCALFHYYPYTWHHLQGTMFKPSGAWGPPEGFCSLCHWPAHVAQVVGLGNDMISQPELKPPCLGMQHF